MPIQEINFEGFMTGSVVINEDPYKEGRVGVWIPKLMSNVLPDENPEIREEALDPGILDNRDPFETGSEIKVVNFYWVRPVTSVQTDPGGKNRYIVGNKVEEEQREDLIAKTVSGQYRVPRLGEQVIVFFLDGDPKKGYYLPFGPTVTGEVIEALHIYDEQTWNNSITRPNIEVLREYWNGNIIAMDTNPETNSFHITFDDGEGNPGHHVRIVHNEKISEIVIDTNNNNKIVLDDTNKLIRIETKQGHEILMDDPDDKKEDNKVIVKTAGGHQFIMDDKEKRIHVISNGGHEILMDDNGSTLKLQDIDGSQVVMSGGNLNISAPSNINIQAGDKVNITAGKINLN